LRPATIETDAGLMARFGMKRMESFPGVDRVDCGRPANDGAARMVSARVAGG
jgi:hypothetical protein